MVMKMKKAFIILIIFSFLLTISSCHEKGIRSYKNEVSASVFKEEYEKAYNKSAMVDFKEKDFDYYYEYECHIQEAYTSESGKTLYDQSYQMSKFSVKHDIDNKVFETKNESIVTRITQKKAIEILGRKTFLSGLSRCAFHWSAVRYSQDDKIAVLFDSYKFFEK